MIRQLDVASRQLVSAGELAKAAWMDVVDPTAEERALLCSARGIPDDFLSHALDPDELARLDDAAGVRLIVVRVPWEPESGGVHRSVALGVVLTEHGVVTICRYRTDVIDALRELDALDPDDQVRFVLRTILTAADRFLHHLREIDRRVGEHEDRLQESLRNAEVYALLQLQKSLVHFETALASDKLLLERLRKDNAFGGEQDLFDDVEVELAQAAQMTATSGNILGEMMDAFASIISNNLNIVMKVLTSLTIVLTFPTMISSLYGMNVALPGQHERWAFYAVLAVSFLVSSLVAAYFVRRKWL
ncbi:MAG: magnesium transporter CorA family protein [Deltaproteobacteria bacterium]|nr:magnesium transporter CorA family protein [Deltaproteobacteria bacterium]